MRRLGFVALVLPLAACGSSEDGELVGSSEPGSPTSVATPADPIGTWVGEGDTLRYEFTPAGQLLSTECDREVGLGSADDFDQCMAEGGSEASKPPVHLLRSCSDVWVSRGELSTATGIQFGCADKDGEVFLGKAEICDSPAVGGKMTVVEGPDGMWALIGSTTSTGTIFGGEGERSMDDFMKQC